MLSLVERCTLSRVPAAAAALRGSGARWLATEQSSGPGFPGQGTMSQEQADKMDQRLYQGDKVEDAPQPKTFKPDKEQPAAEDINQGTGSDRVQTPTSPGRPQDANEPIGGPM